MASSFCVSNTDSVFPLSLGCRSLFVVNTLAKLISAPPPDPLAVMVKDGSVAYVPDVIR